MRASQRQMEEEDDDSEDIQSIQTKLMYAGERWEAGFACYKALQAELDRRAEEKRRRARRARRAREGQNELTGIMRLFCDGQSTPDVWDLALLFGGF